MEVMAFVFAVPTAETWVSRTSSEETAAETASTRTLTALTAEETWAIWVPRAETTGTRDTTAKAATTDTVVWRVPLFCTMGTSSAPVRGPAVVSCEIF
jgi:hypothetical protein